MLKIYLKLKIPIQIVF